MLPGRSPSDAPRGGTLRARRGGRRTARPVSALVGRALRDLGLPSAKVSAAVRAAWAQAADPAWQERARPARLLGGVLEVEVDSAPLREELAQFHATRLLAVLQEALAGTTLLGLRFVPAGGEGVR
jgi:hypothetical protein